MKYRTWSLALLAIIFVGFLWRYTGERMTFTLPKSVIYLQGVYRDPRDISFLRHWPILGWNATREIEPTFFVDTVIWINLSSPEVTEMGWSDEGKSFRVTQTLSDKVSHIYFLKTDEVIKGAKYVTLRIKSYGPFPSDAIHQEDWFWVREFYDCEVVAKS
jgi:hypothetical protein